MIRRPPRSTQGVSSAASDVYKRQGINAEYMGLQERMSSEMSKSRYGSKFFGGSILPVEEMMPGSKEDDVYRRMKMLEDEHQYLEIMEEYIKDEQKNLKREYIRAKEEVKRIQSVPLVIGQFLEMINENYAII
eukprot:TRINITY_DN20458_c0_g1_i3.p2 TRINITY_DN20458_c0_g1~~TRINITY_DN20458_c0_g1_i3.p2  ORF type:complete len:133 (-),score=39.88 TRINITY_DN20458_c0_g1_i3:317-715(-)